MSIESRLIAPSGKPKVTEKWANLAAHLPSIVSCGASRWALTSRYRQDRSRFWLPRKDGPRALSPLHFQQILNPADSVEATDGFLGHLLLEVAAHPPAEGHLAAVRSAADAFARDIGVGGQGVLNALLKALFREGLLNHELPRPSEG